MSSPTPLIVACLPEPELQILRNEYRLVEFANKAEGDYAALVRSAHDSLVAFFGYEPPCVFIRDAIAPVVVRSRMFLEYVSRKRGAGSLDANLLAKLSTAAAGTLVARFLKERDAS